MTDDDCDDAVEENQPSVYMRTSSADGLSGADVEVEVKGGAGETTEDIEATAERRFEQAADRATSGDSDSRREYQ